MARWWWSKRRKEEEREKERGRERSRNNKKGEQLCNYDTLCSFITEIEEQIITLFTLEEYQIETLSFSFKIETLSDTQINHIQSNIITNKKWDNLVAITIHEERAHHLVKISLTKNRR